MQAAINGAEHRGRDDAYGFAPVARAGRKQRLVEKTDGYRNDIFTGRDTQKCRLCAQRRPTVPVCCERRAIRRTLRVGEQRLHPARVELTETHQRFVAVFDADGELRAVDERERLVAEMI